MSALLGFLCGIPVGAVALAVAQALDRRPGPAARAGPRVPPQRAVAREGMGRDWLRPDPPLMRESCPADRPAFVFASSAARRPLPVESGHVLRML